MKKGFKIAGVLAGLAAAAALIPYSVKENEEGDASTTVRALLWKYTSRPDPEDPTRRQVLVDLGWRLPERNEAQEDPATDLVEVDGVDVPPQCDIELTLEPKLDDDEPCAAPEDNG